MSDSLKVQIVSQILASLALSRISATFLSRAGESRERGGRDRATAAAASGDRRVAAAPPHGGPASQGHRWRPARLPPPPPAGHVNHGSRGSARFPTQPSVTQGSSRAARPPRLPSTAPAPQPGWLPFKPTTPRVFRTRQWPAREAGRGDRRRSASAVPGGSC